MSDAADERLDATDLLGELRRVTGRFASGVTVVISLAGDAPHATTATAFVPVSSRPPLVAVFFATGSRAQAHLERSGRFSVNVLAEDDFGLASRFARPSRLTGWDGLTGAELVRRDPAPPILAAAAAWLDCVTCASHVMGDHHCFVGQVVEAGCRPDAQPLVAYRGRFHRLGHAVAPAPWLEHDPDDFVSHW